MKFFLTITLLSTLLFSSIDINTATMQELMSLKGIGKTKAKHIIKYRKKHCFRTIKELTNVRCITKKLIKKNSAQLTALGCKRPDTKQEIKRKRKKEKKHRKKEAEKRKIQDNVS